jgi:hypothetical protein
MIHAAAVSVSAGFAWAGTCLAGEAKWGIGEELRMRAGEIRGGGGGKLGADCDWKRGMREDGDRPDRVSVMHRISRIPSA